MTEDSGNTDQKKVIPLEVFNDSMHLLQSQLNRDKGVIASYCNSDGKPHKYNDFKSDGIDMKSWIKTALTSKVSCKKCGYTITTEDRASLYEIREFERKLNNFNERINQNLE